MRPIKALSLFVKAVLEVRRGRRLMTVDPQNAQARCELVTPTLAALEWALKPEKLELPDSALTRMRDMIAAPAKPGAALRGATKRPRR